MSLDSESDGTPSESCATCRGAGFLRYDVLPGDPQFGQIVPCPACGPERERQRLARVAERISAGCGLEERQRSLSFEGFERYSGNVRVLEAAREFAERGIEAGQWLLIRGKETGTGKTHLLCAIANRAIKRGVPTIYAYTTDLLDHLRAGYGRQGDGENDEQGDFEDRWERVKRVQVLLLDDLGVQVNSAWVRERMEALLDARLRAGLATAITTNLSDQELIRISPRVFDRLDRYAPGVVVEMRAIKYRLWKRQQGTGRSAD